MRSSLLKIQFQENDEKSINKVQLLRLGSFDYCGETLDITPEMLREMKKNFDDNVKRVDLAVDYFHASYAEAAGWITDVILENNDSELWIDVEWTETARQKIMGKEIRYLSADFHTNYRDNETGESYGAVLNGGGLTNRPFVKGMEAILSEVDVSEKKRDAIKKILSEEGDYIMNFEDLKKEMKNLSDDQKAELAELLGYNKKETTMDDNKQLSEIQQQVKTLSEKNETLAAENKKLSDQLAAEKKEREFEVLLSEGKAVEAQRESFMNGNMAEFVKLSVPTNMIATGKGETKQKADDAPKTSEDANEKLYELSQERAKEKNITFMDAGKEIRKENPDLVKLAG